MRDPCEYPMCEAEATQTYLHHLHAARDQPLELDKRTMRVCDRHAELLMTDGWPDSAGDG